MLCSIRAAEALPDARQLAPESSEGAVAFSSPPCEYGKLAVCSGGPTRSMTSRSEAIFLTGILPTRSSNYLT
eukprot:6136331-Pleurochrysis_carterae.AAC.1